jgi:hypothetical protein
MGLIKRIRIDLMKKSNNKRNANTVNKVNKFVTLFALTLSYLPGLKYRGIKPDAQLLLTK